MKTVLKISLLLGILTYSINLKAQNLTPTQIDQIDRSYSMFFHFGVNTFNEIEWSKGDLPDSSYNPTQLNCDEWIKEVKKAGFR